MKARYYNLVFFLFGIVFIAYMIMKIGVDTIVENIAHSGWWFPCILGSWLAVYVLNAASLSYVLQDKLTGVVPFRKLLKLIVCGCAMNYITPVITIGGEPYRILELKKYVGIQKATSSIIAYKLMHVLAHLIYFLFIMLLVVFSWAAGWLTVQLKLGYIIAFSVIFCALALGVWLFYGIYQYGLVVKLATFAEKLPFLNKYISRYTEKNADVIAALDAQIVDLKRNRCRSFYNSMWAEFLSRIVAGFEIYFILLAVGSDINFLEASVVTAFASLFVNILFFVPLQVGTREGGYGLALTMLVIAGVNGMTSMELGIYTSLITRIREVAWILLGLILLRTHLGISWKQKSSASHAAIMEQVCEDDHSKVNSEK